MIMNYDKRKDKHDLNLNNLIISSVNSITLFGIEIDKKLNLEKYLSTFPSKASRQLNAIS